jgi:hypothetical protein
MPAVSAIQLEQRVKSLEYEMKILKNQLQRALLDIQEQILIHEYPELRGERRAAAEDATGPQVSVRPGMAD